MAVTNTFAASPLDLNGKVALSQPTALVWGPDGRLYVTEVDGDVKVLTVAFGDKTPGDGEATASFHVTDAVTLGQIRAIQNHDDDGTTDGSNTREVTGIDVTRQYDAEGRQLFLLGDGSLTTADTGTPAATIYVTSSDSRIGARNSGADIGLDTNSGIVTRLTQTGPESWSAVDIVRGLPRSEENHATNGLEVIQRIDGSGRLVSERIIVAQGGNANAGAPSNNFAGQQELPLSAAILQIDLDALKAMPVRADRGRAFVYDAPTLDDPTRDPDTNDPAGGNDGLNSARLLADGIVGIYSPGYRNAFDVEVTEDGRVWTYDNGTNDGWGGRPLGEAGDDGAADFAQDADYIATNLNNSDGNNGDDINLEAWTPSNKDNFHEVTRSDDLGARVLSTGGNGAVLTFTDPATGLTHVYGGHPNPTRAEGPRAGLLYSPDAGTDNAFLMVSDRDSTGNGGASDYDEVVAWLAEVEDEYPAGGSYGVAAGGLMRKVLAVTPGILYDIYRFADGYGAAVPAGGPAPTGGTPIGQAGLPADIAEIVAAPNPIEGDYREAGRTDGALDSGNGSINGLAEYTSTILDAGGIRMSGAILASQFNGGIIVMGRSADGTMSSTTNDEGFAVAADRTVIATGGAPLGLSVVGDDAADRGLSLPFQGSIWSAVYGGSGAGIRIFQPDNGAVPLAGSEVVDPDDQDLDGVDNLNDPFEFSASNGYALAADQTITLDFDTTSSAFPDSFSGTGLLGAALDGATPNRDAQTAAENYPAEQQRDGLFDNGGNVIPGGNAPILQIKSVVAGSIVGDANGARDALHTGVHPSADVQLLVATLEVANWIPAAGGILDGQLSGLIFGDGTQSNFLRVVFGEVRGAPGIEVGYELGDTAYDALAQLALPALGDAGVEGVELRLEIDIGAGHAVRAFYRLDGASGFTEVALAGGAGFELPPGVLRDVLGGTHRISDGDTTLASGAAIGVLAETGPETPLRAIDFPQLKIEGFGSTPTGTPVRIQGEDFDAATRYARQDAAAADERALAWIPARYASGSASYQLAGEVAPGSYRVVVGYFDENDGTSEATVRIASDAGSFREDWVFDGQSSSSAAKAASFRTRVLEPVTIGANAVLTIDGTRDLGEHARIDYLEFIPLSGGGEPGNTPPSLVAPLPDLALLASEAISIDLSDHFTDPDPGDKLSYRVEVDGADAPWLTVDAGDGILSGTPGAASVGTRSITVYASDGRGEVSDTFLADVAPEPGGGGEIVRIEAETFTLPGQGFYVETLSGGRQVIRLPNKGTGEATFAFDDLSAPGGGGRHDLRVWFLDESDGTSDATLLVDPDGSGSFEEIASFRFDRNDGLSAGQAANLRSLTFAGLDIGPGTVLKIAATARGGEYARFDYVELVPADGGSGGSDGGGGVATSGSATVAIGATQDDHETRGGNPSDDLELGYNAGYPSPVGLRFTGIDLPSTADVTAAYFVFEAKEAGGGAADLRIEIEDSLTVQPYSGASKPNWRDYLNVDVDWPDVEAWQGGESHRSPDISALIEALVDGRGLQATDAIAFRISGTGTRTAWSFDGIGAAPQLVIAYDDIA